MNREIQRPETTNKTLPIIIGALGTLYGLSPIDIIPDFIPVAGWMDDLVITGGSLLGVAQAFAAETNVFFARFLGFVKWGLWILGGIAVLLLALVGVSIYNVVK